MRSTGFASDIERTEMLHFSLVVQMWRGLTATPVPAKALSSASCLSSCILQIKLHHDVLSQDLTVPTCWAVRTYWMPEAS